MRASYEERHLRQTQPSTVIGNDQNGNPGRDNWQQGHPFWQALSGQAPLFVFLLALLQLLTTLLPQALPLFCLRFARTPAGARFGLRNRFRRRFLAALLVPDRLPNRIFQLAALADAAPLGA